MIKLLKTLVKDALMYVAMLFMFFITLAHIFIPFLIVVALVKFIM
ncbi:hypothetical protein [Pasteurella phage vB_PmuP_PS07]|nr:hypothetical protein [Pasteurella phage vB_PmuP_PS07]UIS74040.1 hypothetical protein [Pasteurella phage vB_PmuP_PS30]